jgi:hypothetical protein
VGGLTATTPAAQRDVEAERPTVRIEIRGRLQVLATPTPADGDIVSCLPPPFQYAIEVDGQRFHLQMTSAMGKGSELDGRQVIVSGELDLDTVRVRNLRQPTDDPLLQYARASAPGRLELLRRVASGDWELHVGERVFVLDFANDGLRAQAQKTLTDHHGAAEVEGTLKGGRIVVTSVKPHLVRH